MEQVSAQRKKLLGLIYAGKISADGFKEEEDQLLVDRTQAALRSSEAVQTPAYGLWAT